MRTSVFVVFLIGCERVADVGGGTAEAPLRELVSATMTGDAGAMRHALVSPDRLRKAVSCPASNKLFSDLELAVEHVGEVAKLVGDAKPKVEVMAMTQTGSTKLSSGDNFRGCTANEPFEVRNFSIKMRMSALGQQDETDDTGDVIQLDGRWYALLKE